MDKFNEPGAGAGRGGQGGPTAKQADQNRAMMSASERAARDQMQAEKDTEAAGKAYEAARTTMKKGGYTKKMAAGGDTGDVEDLSKGAYDRALSDTTTGYGFAKKVHSAIDRLFSKQDTTAKTAPAGALTKTKESVTVSPGKKRGGKC